MTFVIFIGVLINVRVFGSILLIVCFYANTKLFLFLYSNVRDGVALGSSFIVQGRLSYSGLFFFFSVV